MVVDPNFKWIVIGMVITQIVTLYLLRNVSSWTVLFLCAYFFTGVINHSLTLAIHEISHNHAFGHSKPMHNRILGMIANLPIGFPMSITFKKYHLEHHRYQGDDILDTDIPSSFETKIFTTSFRKLIWVVLQPLFYGIRPLIVFPKPPTLLEFINLVVQLVFDIILGLTLGWHMLVYMIFASLICLGLHPIAGHFISEHYIMFNENKDNIIRKAKQMHQLKAEGDQLSTCEFINGVYSANGMMIIPETCSYYGPLNLLTFNVGYHVEHHDFPGIPGTLLPQVSKIAPEYYESLHYHTSWTNVLIKYIMDPNVGPFSRVKRPHTSKHVK